jgi:L-ascorbate metabolism protein UlaG (beta-lactamase superfamily)
MNDNLNYRLKNNILINEEFVIGKVFVKIIKLSHDVNDINGYIFNFSNKRLAYITDTGYINIKNNKQLDNCNGYIIEKEGYRVYVSGDTEDIPEMRALDNIDLAFVCMNLPYTMVVDQAASAVLEFKPKEVIPFHYRGTEGKLDTDKFKSLVNAGDQNIKVKLMNWYPE